MICFNCGQQLDDATIYCEQCGVKVGKKDATKFISESEGLNRFYELEYELGEISEELATLPYKQAYLARLEQSKSQKFNQLQLIRQVMYKEKKDYDSLLKVSFSSIKARLGSNLDEKKRIEEAEYMEALVNFEFVEKEYLDLVKDAKLTQDEIYKIEGLKSRIPLIENEMEKILAQITSGKTSNTLKELENQNTKIQEELSKAQNIFNKFQQADTLLIEAQNHLSSAVQKLRSAEGLGTWDTFFGGGIFVDGMKHGNLDRARNEINKAQAFVRRAKEFVDVIDDIYIDFEAPNLFFDMFFDNFFFDLFGNSKISRTRQRVEDSLIELNNSRKSLYQHQNNWEQKRNHLSIKINKTRKRIREERLLLLEP